MCKSILALCTQSGDFLFLFSPFGRRERKCLKINHTVSGSSQQGFELLGLSYFKRTKVL